MSPKFTSTVVIKRIEEQIKKLETEISDSLPSLLIMEFVNNRHTSEQISVAAIQNASARILPDDFMDSLNALEKRNILKIIIKDIIWDGNKITVNFHHI